MDQPADRAAWAGPGWNGASLESSEPALLTTALSICIYPRLKADILDDKRFAERARRSWPVDLLWAEYGTSTGEIGFQLTVYVPENVFAELDAAHRKRLARRLGDSRLSASSAKFTLDAIIELRGVRGDDFAVHGERSADDVNTLSQERCDSLYRSGQKEWSWLNFRLEKSLRARRRRLFCG